MQLITPAQDVLAERGCVRLAAYPGGAAMPGDYLFLWKPDPTRPAAYADELMARFNAAGSIIEDWRCGSHKAIRPGDRAYVFAQAQEHRCIFAVGTVDGWPKGRQPGDPLPMVPLRLDLMAHPNAGGLNRSMGNRLYRPSPVEGDAA